jgi:hypothetical protein
MRLITLPVHGANSVPITIDVARIVAVSACPVAQCDERGTPIMTNGKYTYVVSDSRCWVSIEGYREGTDGDSTASIDIALSPNTVIRAWMGHTHEFDWSDK